jgi:hypothetical protein
MHTRRRGDAGKINRKLKVLGPIMAELRNKHGIAIFNKKSETQRPAHYWLVGPNRRTERAPEG